MRGGNVHPLGSKGIDGQHAGYAGHTLLAAQMWGIGPNGAVVASQLEAGEWID